MNRTGYRVRYYLTSSMWGRSDPLKILHMNSTNC